MQLISVDRAPGRQALPELGNVFLQPLDLALEVLDPRRQLGRRGPERLAQLREGLQKSGLN
jgi:hypothetical protein